MAPLLDAVRTSAFWSTALRFVRDQFVSEKFPIIYLARYGETAWSLTGQHTELTDLPLTEAGERNTRRLAERLKGLTFVERRAIGNYRWMIGAERTFRR